MTQEAIAVSTTPPLPGLQMVQQVNDALETIATDFAGTADPAALAGPYMVWADTANGLLKRRNAAGTAWVVEGSLLRQSLASYASGDIPTSDVGDIFVIGAGRYSWLNGLYVPNNFPVRFRSGGLITVTTNTAAVGAGAWRSAANDSDILLAVSISKVLQASGSWAAGSGANGLFSGAAATSTWYHVFVIRNDATGAVDVGFDTSVTAANRPSGWTAYRRVGSIFNRSSGGVLPFVQSGSQFNYNPSVTDVSNAGLGNNLPTDVQLTIPAGIATEAKLDISIIVPSGTVGLGVSTPSIDALNNVILSTTTAAVEVNRISNTNRQVTIRANQNTFATGLYIVTRGYTDFLGD